MYKNLAKRCTAPELCNKFLLHVDIKVEVNTHHGHYTGNFQNTVKIVQ